MPLSVALHAAVFYAIGLVPWAASEMPQPQMPQHQVVWMKDWPRLVPDEPALDPTQERATVAPTPPPEEPETERIASAVPPPPARPAPQRPSPPLPREPRPAPVPDRSKPVGGAAASSEDAPAAAPEVDWDKERHDAVQDVIAERARRREYLTFSLDDLVKEPEPEDAVLPPLMIDSCVIVKGKLQRFAALMFGRCVREARGELFALIKPAYLKAHPVCIETRPDNPGSFLSDGRQISTVKCELVVGEEE